MILCINMPVDMELKKEPVDESVNHNEQEFDSHYLLLEQSDHDIKVELDDEPNESSGVIQKENINNYCEQNLNITDTVYVHVEEPSNKSTKDRKSNRKGQKNIVKNDRADSMPVKPAKKVKKASCVSGQAKKTFIYTERQKQTLLDLYSKRKYPDKQTYENLATDFQLPIDMLMNWFKRRRFKDKPVSGIKNTFYGFKSKVGEWQCDDCGKIFSKLKNLRLHVQCHNEKTNKPHSCHKCKKSFNRKGDLNRHLLIHGGIKNHMCDICSKLFYFKSKLSEHMNASHGKTKQYVCHICDKAFGAKTYLNRHILRHSNIKKHTCDVCERSFLEKSNLNEHAITHTGIRNYICHICSMSFTRMSSLKKHLLRHTGIKNFTCSICDRSFSERWYLAQHSLTHSNIKNHTCYVCYKSFIDKRSFNRHMVCHKE